ncbi:MAG: SprT-like domain-containing protein [Gemmatimonadota bacterium]|nr:MAG: SprT-like domain-containing protein [Gemmatimonadota bacterium]
MRRKSRRAWAEAAARRADEELLARRLAELGLPAVPRLEMHENRTVLVSITKHGALRVHRGYAYASDRVLQAVVTYVSCGAGRAAHRQAERLLGTFPVDEFVPAPGRRPPRPRPSDRRVLSRLRELHGELNRRHFGGALSPIAFRVSSRMRTRLGEITLDARSGGPIEIAVSRHHIAHDGWEEVVHTVLHEMVHQWQAETGQEADHGAAFRRKAREVGIAPVASRDLDVRSRYVTGDQEEEGAA